MELANINYIVENRQWQAVLIPGDGHCLLHAIRISWTYQLTMEVPSYEQVKKDISLETNNHMTTYLPDIGDRLKLINDLNNYLVHKHYNSDFGDNWCQWS